MTISGRARRAIRTTRIALSGSIAVCVALAAGVATAQQSAADATAQQSAADAAAQEGTRLARRGLLRAARREYQEAVALGRADPLLDYNIGVTQYRLGELQAAEASFSRAAADPRLAGLALYNLGLTRQAAADVAGAEQAFAAAAADPSAGADLRALAERASASIVRPAERERSPVAASRLRQAPVGELSLSVVSGYGFDDNIYRTPSAAYTDLAKPDQPEVEPVIVGAGFVPVDLLAEYRLHTESGDADFLFTYELDAKYYESEFANADDVSQVLSLSAELPAEGAGGGARLLRPTLYFFDHYRSNYDPDDGFERELELGEEDLEHRISYRGGGVGVDYQRRFGSWSWSLRGRMEGRFHKTVPIVASYDQNIAALETDLGYAFPDGTRLTVGLRRYRRTFDERLSRDLSGGLLGSNPRLDYDYEGVRIGVERWLSRVFLLEIDALLLRRTDRFEGYEDYDQTAVQVAGSFRPGSRFEIALAAVSRTYNYPNAFAFHLQAAGPRETEYVSGEMFASYRFNDRLSLWAELELFEATSTDLRAQWERSRSGLGIRWRL